MQLLNCFQTAPKGVQRRTVPGDSSVMTYRGHSVQKTLIRAKFSPVHTTGQRFIYTGSACGSVYSKAPTLKFVKNTVLHFITDPTTSLFSLRHSDW